ncbi:MAG: RNA polymerase sigma factor [Robiginitalea sp.]
MKIISLIQQEKTLIRRAAAGRREAQKSLYERYAPGMLALCQRYVKDPHFSEDIMLEGFVKVFSNLNSFEFRGSFEGWVRRIMVREAIDFLRKRQFVVFDDVHLQGHSADGEISDPYQLEELEHLINALPEGYRLVFNLYAVEGYKHAEIGKLLGISENTSKSQLYKARKQLQEQLKKTSIRYYGTH